jgi:hypothetical protein
MHVFDLVWKHGTNCVLLNFFKKLKLKKNYVFSADVKNNFYKIKKNILI